MDMTQATDPIPVIRLRSISSPHRSSHTDIRMGRSQAREPSAGLNETTESHSTWLVDREPNART